MTLTWLGIVVIGILLLNGYRGYKRGFVREVVSFFFVFLALAAAWAINPYVNDFFMETTPVYEKYRKAAKSLSERRRKNFRRTAGKTKKRSRRILLTGWNCRSFCNRALTRTIQRTYTIIWR